MAPKRKDKAVDVLERAVAKVASGIQHVVVPQPKMMRAAFEIVGTAPLIQHNFAQKAIEEILRKHMGISVQREKKRPADLIEAAKILNEKDEVCIPPAAIKKGMLQAAAAVKGLKPWQLRTMFFVEGHGLPIRYERMVPRMDIVRVGRGGEPDVRFRPMFEGWSARLCFSYSDTGLSTATLIDLLERAGRGGVGEWRPSRDGVYGTYKIARPITAAKEVAEVLEACAVPIKAPVIPAWAIEHGFDPEALAAALAEEAARGAVAETA